MSKPTKKQIISATMNVNVAVELLINAVTSLGEKSSQLTKTEASLMMKDPEVKRVMDRMKNLMLEF